MALRCVRRLPHAPFAAVDDEVVAAGRDRTRGPGQREREPQEIVPQGTGDTRLAGQIRRIFSECGGEIDLVLLLLPQDLADVLGDAVLSERFALAHPLTVGAD